MSPPHGLQRWLLVQASLWTPLLALFAWQTRGGSVESAPAYLWILCGLLCTTYVSLWRALGAGATAADWVTLARFFGLVALVAAAAAIGGVNWPIWCAALAVVLSDLVDGAVARTFGGSENGAILDMETDQLTTLSLSVLAAGCAAAGPWTLALPGLKYLFVLLMTAIGARAGDPRPKDGDNRRGRVVCALVMTLLLAALAPPVPAALRATATGLAVVLLAWSFSSDAAHLWRAARRAATVR